MQVITRAAVGHAILLQAPAREKRRKMV